MADKDPAWLEIAATHVGFHEGADNKNPFGTHYNIPNQPWCALFVSFCCERSGHPLPSMQPGMPDGYAGVWYGMQWAKSNGFFRPSWESAPGDAVVYGWDGPDSASNRMHTGLIVSAGKKGTTAHTIEGNRADQCEKQTFTVGESIVLGTIALTKILAKPGGVTKVKPDPQQGNPADPSNTGPGDPTKLLASTQQQLVSLTNKLNGRAHPVAAADGERDQLRAAAAAIERVLALK